MARPFVVFVSSISVLWYHVVRSLSCAALVLVTKRVYGCAKNTVRGPIFASTQIALKSTIQKCDSPLAAWGVEAGTRTISLRTLLIAGPLDFQTLGAQRLTSCVVSGPCMAEWSLAVSWSLQFVFAKCGNYSCSSHFYVVSLSIGKIDASVMGRCTTACSLTVVRSLRNYCASKFKGPAH